VKWLGFFLALGLLLPAGAQAQTTIIAPPGSGFPYQRWVDEAAMPTPDLSISIIEGDSEGEGWPCHVPYAPKPLAACAFVEQGTAYFDPLGGEPRFTLYHELGHFVDVATLTDADRRWFADFIRMPVDPWLSEVTHNTAGEDFASVYATCLRFGLRVRFTQMELEDGRYIYPKRHFRLCRWIERVTTATTQQAVSSSAG
jgi:hypothetical protein